MVHPQLDDSSSNLPPANDLAEIRSDMLAFAKNQLNDADQAEDAVQEALVGALKNASSFNQRSSLKTWMFAILKYKIADTLRKRYRDPVLESETSCKDCDSSSDNLFDERGHWQSDAKPKNWGNTHKLVDDQDFWKVFDLCLNQLPGEQARVFMMREYIELTSHEICETLNLTTSNLHVLLYRARMRLRTCLSSNWFEQ